MSGRVLLAGNEVLALAPADLRVGRDDEQAVQRRGGVGVVSRPAQQRVDGTGPPRRAHARARGASASRPR